MSRYSSLLLPIVTHGKLFPLLRQAVATDNVMKDFHVHLLRFQQSYYSRVILSLPDRRSSAPRCSHEKIDVYSPANATRSACTTASSCTDSDLTLASDPSSDCRVPKSVYHHLNCVGSESEIASANSSSASWSASRPRIRRMHLVIWRRLGAQ